MNLPTIFFFLQLTLVRSATPGCSLPAYPKNGKWKVLGSDTRFLPGNTVKPSTTLHVTCDESYKLLGTQLGICGIDGQWEWQTRMGECSKLCPPLSDTNQVSVSCTLRDSETGDFVHVKCSEATHGAIAQFECAQYYTIVVENSTKDYKSSGSGLSKCLNGQWSVKKPNCNPKCGLKTLTGVPLSVNGTKVSEGDYPWQVAVYRALGSTFEFHCGASLISEQVVVTAAHCVTSDNGMLMSARYFALGAGKLHRKFRDPRDPGAQLIRVSNIFIPKNYKGFDQNYFGDIAIVIPGVPFKLTYKIQPICVDWKKKFKTKFFQPSNKGFVSGWGALDERGQQPDVLRELEVPFVKNEECSKAISESDQTYITSDKLCLGYVNQSKGVCAGDSGGALVFKNNFDDRYYLTGIVSVSPDRKSGTSCNSQLYALYTEVYAYLDFVKEKAAEFQLLELDVSDSNESGNDDAIVFRQNCAVPEFIPNGKTELDGSILPNNVAEPGTVMRIKCNEGFQLVGSELNYCIGEQGKTWGDPVVASCIGICRKIEVDNSTHQVYYRNGQSITDDTFANATTVEIACGKGISSYGICKNGAWNPKPKCSLDCGTVKNGRTDKFPWLAGIHFRKPDVKTIVCGGTIISERAIITTAHCLSDYDGVTKPTDNFAISIGHSFEPTITVSSIIKPKQFRGLSSDLSGDIAVIITRETIKFTDAVQPICLDWNLNPEVQSIKIATTSGWGQGRKGGPVGSQLKVMKAPYESLQTCRTKIQSPYKEFLTADKFCLGTSSNDSEIICKGDSGNGVFSKNPSDGKYYLFGVLSNSFSNGCDGFNGATNISYYKNSEIFEAVTWNAPYTENNNVPISQGMEL